METVLAYYWSRSDGERALAYANASPENVTLRRGQRWKGETERCDRVVIFGPLYKVEEAYRAKGVPVEAEDILPDWTPPWMAADDPETYVPSPSDITVKLSASYSEASSETFETELAFASPVAQKAANDAGLTPADFEGVEPSGKTGYTKPDVDAVIARKAE